MNYNNNVARKYATLDLIKENYIATIKSQLHKLATNFSAKIKNEAEHIKALCCSLSHHEAFAKKVTLTTELASLKNMFMLAIQQNPNAYQIVNKFKDGRNPAMTDHTLEMWTSHDFMKALTILSLEFEIERTKLLIQECDTIIQKVEQAAQQITDYLGNLSLDTIENSIKPWLIEEQRVNKIIIAQEKYTLELQTKKLEIINGKLEPFERGSLWAKIGGKFNSNYSQPSLIAAREIAETEIKATNHRLQYLYDKSRTNDTQFTCVQKKLDDLHKEQSESKQNQEYKFSSQAQELIASTNVQFTGLGTLSEQNQQQITSLVNRAAQEQKNINDASYDELISTTIEVADSACQAFQAGKAGLGNALVNFGNSVLDCAIAFSKGLVQGVDKSIQSNWKAITNPTNTLTTLLKSVVHLAGCLHPISAAIVIGSNITSAVNGFEQALQGATQKLNDMSLTEISENLGEKIGEFGTDLLILDGALKSTSIVKNIAVAEVAIILKKAEQGFTALGEFAKAEIAALAESAELVAKTAEGFEVAINGKRADIAKEAQVLHSEAHSLNKAKNTIKSEGATARASREATKFGPNGGYSDAGYHHMQSTGKVKSKGPKSGIEALNNSVEVLNKGGIDKQNKRRIGISNGEFIALSRTHKGATRAQDIFHGHVREWKDLEKPMRDALQEAKLTDKNGKILKK